MLVSVIIPVYNVEKYLCECIDSVLAQDYRELEIILVDDGATDSSSAICDNYAKADERITVYHIENSGLSGARNYGTKMAHGEFIQYLDSDDKLTEGAISSSVAKIEDQTDAVIARIVEWNPEAQLYKAEPFSFKDEYVENLSGEDAFANLMNKSSRPIWSAWRPLFRRSVWVEGGFEFTPHLLSEDLDIMPHFYRKCRRIAVSDRENVLYRVAREGSIMATVSLKRYTDIFLIISKWNQFLADKSGCSELFYASMRRQIDLLYLSYLKKIRHLKGEDKQVAIAAAKQHKHLLGSRYLSAKYRLSYRLLGFKATLRLMHSL